MNKAKRILFISGILICLLQIWWPAYYVTGDGPCHLYNAQIMHDLWAHENVPFYSRYFSIVYQPNPNWMTTVVLALLLFLVKGAIVEKIYLSIYLLVYISGFYLLLKKISNNNSWWPLSIFIFVFTMVFAKGFYNYSFSIAFFFWVVWCWLRFLDRSTVGNALLFFVFSFFIFFTHLLPFVFAAATCGALVASYTFSSEVVKKNKGRYFARYAIVLLLLLSPYIALMNWFVSNEGGMQLKLNPHLYRFIELAQFKYLVNITHQEDGFSLVAACTLIALFCIALLLLVVRFTVSKYDGFLLSFIFVLGVYILFPDDFMGRVLGIAVRVQLFVLLLAAICVSYRLSSTVVKNFGAGLLFICFCSLSVVRSSAREIASRGVEDYLGAASYIRPYCVVLPFDFSRNGLDEKGRLISDRNHLFSHVTEYMGAEKPLIILDNFEAHMGYFPISWTDRTNPYDHLSKDEGIEGAPPYASLDDYYGNTGVRVDYIIMWCFDTSYLKNAHFKELYEHVNSGYHIIYKSPTMRTVLYEKNGDQPAL